MIPLAIPQMTGAEWANLKECVDLNFVSSIGPFVGRFEEIVAQEAGARAAVATSSGSTGLHVALVAVGVKPGDLVVLPTFTFIASANAIHHCGADPWLLDIEDDWNLSVEKFKEVLFTKTRQVNGDWHHIASGRRIAAIMPVYTLGSPADMDSIVEVARSFGIPVVADAAAALGSQYRGRPPAALGADLTVFSFNGNKTVTCGGGGAVCADDLSLAAHVRHLTTTARVGANYDHDEAGFNYRLTNLQAAVGCAQLQQLASFVAKKRKIADSYRDAFAEVPGCRPFPVPRFVDSACWLSGIYLDDMEREKIPALVMKMRDQGLDVRQFWKPVHLQKPYSQSPMENLSLAERTWERVLPLPCSTSLTENEQLSVISIVKALLS